MMSIETATFILAVVTAFMAAATAAMAYWTRNMAIETKRSTNVAEDSLSHEKEVRIESLRPHLVVLSINDIAGSQDYVRFPHRQSPIQVSPAYKAVATHGDHGRVWYSVPFKNIGPGPARITSFEFTLGPSREIIEGEKHLTDSIVPVGGRTRASFTTLLTPFQDASTYPSLDGGIPEVRWDCHIELRYTNLEKSEGFLATFQLQWTAQDVVTVSEVDTQPMRLDVRRSNGHQNVQG